MTSEAEVRREERLKCCAELRELADAHTKCAEENCLPELVSIHRGRAEAARHYAGWLGQGYELEAEPEEPSAPSDEGPVYHSVVDATKQAIREVCEPPPKASAPEESE